MSALDAAAQLVIDQLNRHEDFSEALGQLCVLFVEKHKQTVLKRNYSRFLVREKLHDHDRVVSYLWERASDMLEHLVPQSPHHFFSLLNRLISFCTSDAHRKEDKDKQGSCGSKRQALNRNNVHLSSGSALVHRDSFHDVDSTRATVFDTFTCLDYDHDVAAMEAEEEVNQLLEVAERGALLLPARCRGFFRYTVQQLLQGSSMKQIGQDYGMTESRVSQLTTACLHSLVQVLRGRYPAMDAIPSDVLFHRIHAAINKLKPARTRGRTGGSRVLSPRRQRKDELRPSQQAAIGTRQAETLPE